MDKPNNHAIIFMALKHLIDEGRVTGVDGDFKLDGVAFVAEDDNTYDPTPATFNDNGFSDEMSEYGGFQIKDVEDVRAELLRSGDARKERIAHELPQYFVVLDSGANFTDKQNYLARENHAQVWQTRAMSGMEQPVISTMSEWTPKFYKKGTKEPEYRYNQPIENVDVVRGGANPGATIPNHRIAVAKDGKGWTPQAIGDWARRWVSQYEQTGKAPEDAFGSGLEGSNQ